MAEDRLETWFIAALSAHGRGDPSSAERLCRDILASDPRHLGALHALAVLALEREHFAAAERFAARALAINPTLAAGYSASGRAFAGLGRPDEALAAYDRALALKPDDAEAMFNRGLALITLERREEAIESFGKAASVMSEPGPALFNQGNLLFDLGRFDEAVSRYNEAIQHEPGFAVTHNNCGNALRESNRLEAALAAYDRAIVLKPDYAEAHNNRGIALQRLGRREDALASYDQAVVLQPGLAESFYNRGLLLADMKRPGEALASFDRAVALKPDHAQAASHAFDMAARLCDWRDRGERTRDLVERVRTGLLVAPFILLGACDEPELHAKASANAAEAYRHDLPRLLPFGHRANHPRLRVAYVSADFHEHAVGRAMVGLFEQADRRCFELSGVFLSPPSENPLGRRIAAAFDHVIDASGLTDKAIAALLREREIDIAVDLMGYTRGSRTRIFIHRAAPLQVGYFGYPGSLGADFIDYAFADRIVIPEAAKAHFAERIIYLPDSYLPTDSARASTAPPPARARLGLPAIGFVFCCLNAPNKIAPDMFDLWMKLLRTVESSVLWLYADNDIAQANLRREAASRGIASKRLVFAPPVDYESHVSRMAAGDLFLDTLPYNAHSTASDALWAGLPVITCAGRSFSARVAASALAAIGLPELATDSLADYERLALSLARDPERLAAIRARLADNRKSYPLFDTAHLCRQIETSYHAMWERHRSGQAPQSFAV